MVKFIYKETKPIEDDFVLGARIGQPGASGYAVRLTPKNATYDKKLAAKVIDKTKRTISARHFKMFREEIKIMQEMKHDNIIDWMTVYESESKLYIVMELCEGGELFDRIKAKGRYTEKDAATVLRQLFTGLAYMHEKKIVHCDLKPENFLFLSGNDDSPIKIIDFGFSKYTKRRQYHNSFCGTAFYVAPEVLNGSYRESCDLWSLGVITFIMLTGYPPFFSHSGNDKDIFRAIKKGFTNEVRKGFHAGCFSEASKLSESCRDFISKLLVLAPEKRLTANEALSHPWLTGEKASGEPISAVLSKLGSFTARCRLKKAFLVSMTNVVCDDELKALRTSFSEIDVNGDGTLSLSEIASVVSKKGECKLSMSLAAAIDQVDMDHDGTLDYSEILLVAVERKVIAKEERMLAEFHKIDTNHDNRLSVREIMQVVEDADTETVKKMIAEVDTNGDGYIDYDEFLTIFLGAE